MKAEDNLSQLIAWKLNVYNRIVLQMYEPFFQSIGKFAGCDGCITRIGKQSLNY